MKLLNLKNTILPLCLFSLLLSIHTNALEKPKPSKYDSRIGFTDFNRDDVFSITAKSGYVSVIEFDENEKIINTATGFSEGWELVDRGNLLFIKPKPISTKYIQSDDPEAQNASSEIVISPNAKDWHTNLIVTTTYSMYVFELNIGKQEIFKLTFNYPAKTLARMEAVDKKIQQELEKKAVNTALNRTSVPRNWEFYMRAREGSESIKPNFAYDDGVFTYIGFDSTKTFPSVFGLENNEEQILNTHVKKDGNYDVLVVQKIMPKMVLRSGDKVVGILNKGYGKNSPKSTQQTSNDNEVIRGLQNGQ